MITQTIDLNLIPFSAPVVVHVDQYDYGTGRIKANLYNGDVAYTPSGGSVTIQGHKPDGKGFAYGASLSGNVVTANLTEQMTAVAGDVIVNIVVKESSGRTGSFNFVLAVQKSSLPDDSDMSESDYQIAEQLLEEAEQHAEDSEAWAVGQRKGVNVPNTDATYHNNSKFYAEQSASSAENAATAENNAVEAKDDAESAKADAEAALAEMISSMGLAQFTVDYTTGNLMYSNATVYTFSINTTTGNLEWEAVG